MSRKRALTDQEDEVEQKKFSCGNEPLLKVLVTDVVAGDLIREVSELETQYGGHIHISGDGEYYPGTEMRVVLITGKVSEIIRINNYIITNYRKDGPRNMVRIVVTNSIAHILTGPRGTGMSGISKECKVKTEFTYLLDATVKGDCILTVTGDWLQCKHASKQIILKMAELPSNMANTKLSYTDEGMAINNRTTMQYTSYPFPIEELPRVPEVQGCSNLSFGNRQSEQEKYSLSGRVTDELVRDMHPTIEKSVPWVSQVSQIPLVSKVRGCSNLSLDSRQSEQGNCSLSGRVTDELVKDLYSTVEKSLGIEGENDPTNGYEYLLWCTNSKYFTG